MAINFSQQGSNASNPSQGLLGNLKNRASNFAQNITHPFNMEPLNASQPSYGGFDKAINPQPPQKGLLDSHDTSNQRVISKTDNQGNTIKFAPEVKGDTKTSDTKKPIVTPTQTPVQTIDGTPQVGTPKENAQNVLNQSAPSSLGQGAANASALYGMLGNEAQLQPFAGGQTQGLLNSYANLTRPQSTGNLAGESGLFNVQKGILQNAANTTAAQSLAQQNLATGGAENVFGASIPSQISGSSRLYDPLAGASADSGTAGIITGANNQSTYDLQQQYNQGKVALTAANGIKNQIINTLQSNPTLNNTPISALTNLNELLSGQTSDPSQQLLAQQIKSYIDTLGLDPATVVNIAHQSQGTIAQLLDSLTATATAQNEAKNPANLNLANNKGNQSTSGSTGGATWNDIFG